MSDGPTEPNATPTKKNKKTKVNFNKQYVMNHQSRPKLGRAVIFNNETFDDRIPPLANRKGSEEDVKSLVEILRKLGFQIDEKNDVCTDYTDVKAIEKLEELANEDFSEYNCFFAVFLSHGDSGKLLMRKRELNIQGHILDQFRGNKCGTLSGKPKIFVFQACRGIHIEEAVVGVDADSKDPFVGEPAPLKPPQHLQEPALQASEEMEEENIIVPSGADILLCYASAEGYKAHRYSNDKTKKEKKEKVGSWFIQTFVDVINQYIDDLKKEETKEQDFLSLMTVVVDTVANIAMKDNNAGRKTKKRVQIPSVSSTLRKRIYFPNLTNPQPAEDDKNELSETELDAEEQNVENKEISDKAKQIEESFAHLTSNQTDLASPTEDLKAEDSNKTAGTQENQAHDLESASNNSEFPSENVQEKELDSAANETRNIQNKPAKSPDLSPNSKKFISPSDDTDPEKTNSTTESANGSDGAHPLRL